MTLAGSAAGRQAAIVLAGDCLGVRCLAVVGVGVGGVGGVGASSFTVVTGLSFFLVRLRRNPWGSFLVCRRGKTAREQASCKGSTRWLRLVSTDRSSTDGSFTYVPS